MAILEKIEFEAFGPYRFIGKTVFAPPGSGEVFGGLWGSSRSVFDAIDELHTYATPEIHDVAFMSWDTGRNLLGYTVGRFMRPGTPVPDNLDALDIPASFVAKGWVAGEFGDMISTASKLTEEAIAAQTKYKIAWDEHFIGAEVYTKDCVPRDGVHSVLGYYIPCALS